MDSPFGAAAPILRVKDVPASLAYYVDGLGFTLDWDEGGMVSVSRGRCTIFLTKWEQSNPRMWVWVGVADCEVVHRELASRGARVRQPPTNFPWALEMQIEDLDANVIRIGSEPLVGEPWGNFIDATGKLYDLEPSTDGGP